MIFCLIRLNIKYVLEITDARARSTPFMALM